MKLQVAMATAIHAVTLAPAPAVAQSDLLCNGFQDIVYTGTVEDFLVPDVAGASIFFTVQGADGGDISHTCGIPPSTFTRIGGEGAQAGIECRIGIGPGELAPGGTVRFIVGGKGGNDSGTGGLQYSGGGGGGGTGVLYLPPGGTWGTDGVVLAAAGGGGGAAGSCVTQAANGRDGQAEECGADWDDDLNNGWGAGGCSGNGGSGLYSGPGGGAFTDGVMSSGTDRRGRRGFPDGGSGGTGGEGTGGWGFGGGGRGGGASGAGGGGYSGGGGQDENTDVDQRGGTGGGSYTNPTYRVTGSTLGGFNFGEDGFAQYIIYSYISNDQPQSPFSVFDGVSVSGSFCGATESGAWDCGPDIDGADLWYTYTCPIDCSPAAITIAVTSGDAEIQSYDTLTGTPSSSTDCRGASVNGIYNDTLVPGQTIRFRVQSATGTDFTFVATSAFAPGQDDCDTNGIPDVCDLAADPSLDCNGNGRPDTCDLADGTSIDCDSDGIPDECDDSDDCPPPNDLKENALPVVPGSYFFDTDFAGEEGPSACSDAVPDVWYTFTAPSDGQLFVTNTRFILPDAPWVSIFYTVTILEMDGVTEIACDAGTLGHYAGSDSFVGTPMSAGATVLIRVTSLFDEFYGYPESSWGTVGIEFDPTFTNDRCDGALVVEPDGGPYSFAYWEVEPQTPVQSSCNELSPLEQWDLWYVYTSPDGGAVRFSTDSARTVMTLYDACGGTELACEAEPYVAPAIDWTLAPGESVIIRLAASPEFAGYSFSGNFFVERACMGDTNGDGTVNFDDLLNVLATWGTDGTPVGGDVNEDGIVDFDDLLSVLGVWGSC